MMFRIKLIVRDLLVVMLYLSGFAWLQNLYLRHVYGGSYRILCFHWVGAEGRAGFESKLIWLKRRYDINPLGELLKRQANGELRGNEIAITFDDGFSDFHEVVLPLLIRHDVPVTLFVPSGMLDLNFEEAKDFADQRIGINKPLLDRNQLVDIAKSGLVDIQSHSHTHCDFGAEPMSVLLEELCQSRRTIEGITRQPVDMLAFPYGDVLNTSETAFKALQQADYSFAMTIVPGFNHGRTNKFKLYRDSLNPNMNNFLLRAWLCGGYDLPKKLANLVRVNVKQQKT